jgi:hypothetical protein
VEAQIESRVQWPSRSWVLGLIVVLGLGAAIRFPPLLNAGDMNSDGAIVGIQAMQMLKGDFAGHLYGSSYQTSVEPMLAAALFLLGGPSLLKVALVPFLGMMALLVLVYVALTRQLKPASAVLCLLPLAVGSIATNMPMMYVMRQAMITVLVVGVVLIHTASKGRGSLLRYFLGALFAGLAVTVDTFALVMGPAVALLVLLAIFDDAPGWKRVLLRGAFAAAGALPAAAAAKAAGHLSSEAGGLLMSNVERNWPLFSQKALPFTLNWRVWKWSHEAPSYSSIWEIPEGLRTAQMIAAFVLLALMASAFVLVFVRSIPWQVRRLAVFGAAGAMSAVAIFLGSGAPVDQWSARYLAPMLWLAPFALASVGFLLRPRGLGLLLGPWVAGAIAGAWMTWGPFVDGPLPALTDRGRAADERVLRDALRARGIEAAAADYWLAYRLSMLFEQQPIVVPLSAGQDRLAAHRERFDKARTVALLFHPSEQRSVPQSYLQAGAKVEQIAGFTVVFIDR